jgi:hypothetical protein
MEELEIWSTKQAQSDPVYERCVRKSIGGADLIIDKYLTKKKLDHLFGQQMPLKPEVRKLKTFPFLV